jgi:purine nucleosidase
MTSFHLTPLERFTRLDPPTNKVRMVLDTDTFNEIDDQFALTYALLSPERIELEAVYAAPFHNERSNSPEDGMLKSYDEILHILNHLGYAREHFVFHGARAWLSDMQEPVRNAAVEDLIRRAREERAEPLYVVAIGAITNIATALLLAPDIASQIVVIWLGGNALYWPTAREFNLQQDVRASRVIFDSGVPLVCVPCKGVTDHLLTTQAELERYVKGRGSIGDYLFDIFSATRSDHFAYSRVIWDMAPIAWLINSTWVPTEVVHSPILTTELTYSIDTSRHFIRYAYQVDRDAIFGDLFRKLAQ